ncbi:hypothetical protein QLQ12_10850 [Actinoplanes sp. NEAU-A12]|uniref:Anti-sigma factor n=1 Tax=Actinoplanes sandaracinus TaxID=3045177 RepID=A0ABT6WH94_9ACTN|nr:hypothetical protein [Actinoplanes sandaracinus]MDI6099094.1 hypothetical protein [Actinoplanes sandaracinus]
MTGAEFDGVDLDLLADYVGGALTGTPDEERVAALLAEDPAWQAAHEVLEPGMIAVGAALGDLEPEPMPGDLAARLDALFRAPADSAPVTPVPSLTLAPAADTPAALEPTPAVPATVVDLGKARRLRRWAAPIAVAAAVVAFAGFGVSRLGTTSDTLTDSAAAPAAGKNAAAAPMVAVAPPPGAVARTGADYTEGTLPQAAAGEAATPRMFGSSEPSAVTGADTGGDRLDVLGGTDALAACLQAIAEENSGGAIAVDFVDYARFEGAPALIVRFSAANGTWVWAVGPECGTPGTGADPVKRLPVR